MTGLARLKEKMVKRAQEGEARKIAGEKTGRLRGGKTALLWQREGVVRGSRGGFGWAVRKRR